MCQCAIETRARRKRIVFMYGTVCGTAEDILIILKHIHTISHSQGTGKQQATRKDNVEKSTLQACRSQRTFENLITSKRSNQRRQRMKVKAHQVRGQGSGWRDTNPSRYVVLQCPLTGKVSRNLRVLSHSHLCTRRRRSPAPIPGIPVPNSCAPRPCRYSSILLHVPISEVRLVRLLRTWFNRGARFRNANVNARVGVGRLARAKPLSEQACSGYCGFSARELAKKKKRYAVRGAVHDASVRGVYSKVKKKKKKNIMSLQIIWNHTLSASSHNIIS